MAFEVFKNDSGKFYFNLKASNGQVILSSQGYAAKTGAMNGVQSVINHATNDANFERAEAKDGRVYFNLKASNGQVIGKSQMYKAATGMENGIASVKKNATGDAAVNDLTAG